jgi:DNA polymerase III epsilon subunit-like protein/peroxiredoxin
VSVLAGRRIVVIDVETTGLDPTRDDLLELATVVLDEGAVGDCWSSLVKPGCAIPAGATAVHGITDSMVAEAPSALGVAPELRRRCGSHFLAFHHARFDLPFVAALLRSAGEPPLDNPVVDTLGLARGLAGLPGHSLQELALRLGLPAEPAHRALADALTTARLLVALAARWEAELGVTTLAELAAVSQDVLRIAARRDPAAGAKSRPNGVPPGPAREALVLDLFQDAPAEGDSMVTTVAAPEIGQMAPDFKLKGPGGQFFTLSEHRGHKNVVLVFFPLAFSPTCSHQLPMIERQMDRFRALDAEVMGISVDNHFANDAFAKQLGLDFPLLSDFRREVSALYGVLVPESLHSGRAVFVVDRQGRVAHKEISPAPGDVHKIPSNEKVLQVLEGLK